MTPLLATQDSQSDQWLPSVLPPGQEMSDYLPKTDPVGQFKIPQTENWGKLMYTTKNRNNLVQLTSVVLKLCWCFLCLGKPPR